MRTRTRHRRLVAAACRIYGLTIWLYPPEFRRSFGRELAVTFRTQVEDVAQAGGIRSWLAFVVHIALDTARTLITWRTLLTPANDAPDAASLLGLIEGEVAHGCLDRASLDIQLMFASAGVALAFAGWFVFLVILPKYVC